MPTTAAAQKTTTLLYDKFLCRNYLTFDPAVWVVYWPTRWENILQKLELRELVTWQLPVDAINQHFMQSCAQLSKSLNASMRSGCRKM